MHCVQRFVEIALELWQVPVYESRTRVAGGWLQFRIITNAMTVVRPRFVVLFDDSLSRKHKMTWVALLLRNILLLRCRHCALKNLVASKTSASRISLRRRRGLPASLDKGLKEGGEDMVIFLSAAREEAQGLTWLPQIVPRPRIFFRECT